VESEETVGFSRFYYAVRVAQYFSHAESDEPGLIIPEDSVTCLGRAEDGEWMSLEQVHQHKHMVGNIAAVLPESC